MRLLIVSEGNSELAGSLESLLRRMLNRPFQSEQKRISDPDLRAHHGKGRGYFKKALRCMIYAGDNGFDGVVVLIDQDNQIDRRSQLADAQEHQELSQIRRAMGVAVRMFDAWLLADEAALTTVLGKQVQCQPDPESIQDPKRVWTDLRVGTEVDSGVAALYARVAEQINLDLLERRCPLGFQPFAQRVQTLA